MKSKLIHAKCMLECGDLALNIYRQHLLLLQR
jgi:hypothetical protein